MSLDFKIPELGEGVTEGTVLRLLVTSGDHVIKGQPVTELETDKAVIEVPSDRDGTVAEIRVKEGDKVQVGQSILRWESAGESTRLSTASVAVAAAEADAPAASIPPTTAAEAPTTPAGAPPDAAPFAPEAQPLRAGEEPPAAAGGPLRVSPAVRQCAHEVGVDVSTVRGSGLGGRISYQDVFQAAMRRRPAGGTGAPAADPLPDVAAFGPVERKSLSAVRRTVAERLSRSWTATPQVTHFDVARVTRLDALRKRQAEAAGDDGLHVTITAILVRIVSAALKAFPTVNVSVDMAAGEIVYKKYIHIGVAVDTPHGLMVPVIRHADQKNVLELMTEMGRLADRARNRTIRREELQGGCFTISNLGGLGARHFTPIVNPHETAILGVGRAAMEPVCVTEGAIQPQACLPVSLSYDHRAIDGADATRFLRWLVDAIEDPVLINRDLFS